MKDPSNKFTNIIFEFVRMPFNFCNLQTLPIPFNKFRRHIVIGISPLVTNFEEHPPPRKYPYRQGTR